MARPTTAPTSIALGERVATDRSNSRVLRWRPVTSNTVPHTNKLNCIGFVDIHFRWQKSLRHGQFHTFKALSNDSLCPVARDRRIILRADTLCIPHWTPVAVFHIPETGAAVYVKRITIERFLKKALLMTCPDPNHRITHLEQCFMLKCLHISACLALASDGVPRNDIVYLLRWNSDAVDLYIRESHQSVVTLRSAVVQGTHARGTTPSAAHRLSKRHQTPSLAKNALPCAARGHKQ
jgi:hypothetical protein